MTSPVMKKNEPVYEEMRSLAPYFLTLCAVYGAITVVLFFAMGFDYSLPLGALYGMVICAANFLLLGKTAQNAVKRRDSKSAQTYMSAMYCLRYLGLFLALTLAAIAPFISLITAVIPLFFTKAVILIREFFRKKEE